MRASSFFSACSAVFALKSGHFNAETAEHAE